MKFDTLEDKCRYYQSLANYKLMPNQYVIVHCDGRSFSRMVKNTFAKPFDNEFITIMNKVAEYLCQNVQGVKCAYVQSDEISLVLADSPMNTIFFDGRLCKMQSIIASLATAKFNREIEKYWWWRNHNSAAVESDDSTYTIYNVIDNLDTLPLYQFDCKCWNVPSLNDAYAWLLYRQNDCIKNSKQQAAQTYISHNKLNAKNTDEQIKILLDVYGIDWHTAYNDGEKFGRLVTKHSELMNKEIIYKNGNKENVTYNRTVWQANYAPQFNDTRAEIIELLSIDNIEKVAS